MNSALDQNQPLTSEALVLSRQAYKDSLGLGELTDINRKVPALSDKAFHAGYLEGRKTQFRSAVETISPLQLT